MLKFTKSNRKLHHTAEALGMRKSQVLGFDLPAGWTCPSAQDCKSKADKVTGKITDGADCKFRCYAASAEAAFTSVRKFRWHNFDTLRKLGTAAKMRDALLEAMDAGVKVIRIHTSGDFYNKEYFNAWIMVAEARPDVTFYGYTKQAQYLEDVQLPNNMKLVVSAGGRNDHRAPDAPRAHVVMSAAGHDFPVYNDESSELAVINGTGTFGLLIHGTQPAGSKAAEALKAVRAAK
jgi:hypothetical protein